MNRISRIGLFAALLLVATGCGSASSSDESTGKLEIGVILEARPADQPWSAAMHDASQRLMKRDSSVSVTETRGAYDPTKAEPVGRQFINGGYKVLVLHSFALGDVAKSLSQEFTKVPMSVASFDNALQPNLNIATASYLQIGYSNCWMLARLSKSNVIGFVGPQPIPYATEMLEGCKLGAKAANPGVKVLSAYSNSFTDQQATREQGTTLVNAGADGLFPASATEDSLGGFKLCEDKKINCVGWASDARRYAPNTAVASAIVDWSVLLDRLVEQARSGKLKADTFDATFANKGMIAQPFEGVTGDRVPGPDQAAFSNMLKGLANGSIALPQSKAHPCCE